MKKISILPFLLFLNGCVNQNLTLNKPVSTAANKDLSKEETVKTNAILQIDGFVNTIKPILMSSLKSDPTGASGMDMCSASAQALTKNYNKSLPTNTKIRRTAIKYRNPLNKPDRLDKEVMNKIIDSKSAAPVMIETSNSYRVYKPLDTMKPCLACHGDFNGMNKATVAKIKKQYPKDLANGFKLGDFRGVVVAEIRK